MIFLTDSWPTFCPKCGESTKPSPSTLSDFHAGASHSCNCGAQWQHVPTLNLVMTSKAFGDLSMYAHV